MPSSEQLTRLQCSSLELITLRCGKDHLSFTLHGAHLVSYVHQGIERIWLSPKSEFQLERPIRGGVPICWPWFGAHAEDNSQPAHGFARTSLWQLKQLEENAELAFAILTLSSEHPDYPLEAEYRIELTPNQVSLTLSTKNLGDAPIKLSEALHTYLPISDLETASLHGLQQVSYADKLKNYALAVEDREAVYLTEPTDRVYFDTAKSLELVDSGWGRTTRISKSGSATTVVWNAGEQTAASMLDLGADNYRGYICVEAANALDASINLEAGSSHRLTQALGFD